MQEKITKLELDRDAAKAELEDMVTDRNRIRNEKQSLEQELSQVGDQI